MIRMRNRLAFFVRDAKRCRKFNTTHWNVGVIINIDIWRRWFLYDSLYSQEQILTNTKISPNLKYEKMLTCKGILDETLKIETLLTGSMTSNHQVLSRQVITTNVIRSYALCLNQEIQSIREYIHNGNAFMNCMKAEYRNDVFQVIAMRVVER